jgi:hypothetical protein
MSLKNNARKNMTSYLHFFEKNLQNYISFHVKIDFDHSHYFLW